MAIRILIYGESIDEPVRVNGRAAAVDSPYASRKRKVGSRLGQPKIESVIPPRHTVHVTDSVSGTTTSEALAMIEAGLDLLDEAGVRPRDERDAVVCIKRVERIRRRTESAAVTLMSEIERFDLHRDDGYGSVKAMFAHHARLSGAEVQRWHRSSKMCVAIPEIGDACKRGDIPVNNVGQLACMFANPRVANEMMDQDSWLLSQAIELRPKAFADSLKTWQDLNDADGAAPEAERQHRNRRYRLIQGFNDSWTGEHSHGSMQGAAMKKILDYYVSAETLQDWEEARAVHGDDAAECHLPRTHAQRSADALYRIFEDAASNSDGHVPVSFVHNLVWSQETFEYCLALYLGAKPDPMHPDDYRCETIDGVRVNPMEAVASALISKVRRAVVDAKGTVIDLGQARSFAGSARAAVKLSSKECVWPSCHVPTSNCEADHMTEHSQRGRTNPGNGAPLCGKHNRWKQKGFTVFRDDAGIWHTLRPDGSEIDP